MAHNIVIEKGDEMLQDVTLTKPDTKVNFKSDVKYPTADCSKIGGPVMRMWTEALGDDPDGALFSNPTPARFPAGSDDSSDDSDEGG